MSGLSALLLGATATIAAALDEGGWVGTT
jgi:hypothetical protein